jgi:hypothetical protein
MTSLMQQNAGKTQLKRSEVKTSQKSMCKHFLKTQGLRIAHRDFLEIGMLWKLPINFSIYKGEQISLYR